jgi:dipeptidyl aminopeptidase/acylaminoacyl peptidase
VTLDARARRAADDFRRAVEELDRSAPERSSFERFDLSRRRRQRNTRVGAIMLASVIAIIAMIVVARAFPRAEQPAVPPTTNGRIAFVRFDPTYGEPVAFTMDPDGSDAMPISLTGAWGHSEWPHWSPGGTSVTVFCCDDDPGAAHIVNPDTGEYRALPLVDPQGLEEHCEFAWSPDGRLLACGNYGLTNPRETGLWILRSSDGGGLTQLTSNPGGADEPGDFSPDGKRLVFLHSIGRVNDSTDKVSGLFVIGVDGSGLRRITPKGMNLDVFNGSWSATGNQILFVASADAGHHRAIWEVNDDGSGLRQLPIAGCGGAVSDPKSIECSYPGWSPDGTRIVFTRATEGGKRSDIATVNADGSGLVQITHTGDADEADWGTHPLAS